jgi:predicted ATP-grasp superfamily ATP-dependent carboligase
VTALITCGDTRAGLAAVRSLGRSGLAVAVGAPRRPALAMWSRYTTSTFVLADAVTNPRLFAEQVAQQSRGRGARLVLSATDGAVWALSRHRESLPDTMRPLLPSHDAIVRAVDRAALKDLAESLRIACAETIRVDSASAVEPALRRVAEIGAPCLVRPLIPWTERLDGGRAPDPIRTARVADLRKLLYAREDLVEGGCMIEPHPNGVTLGYGVVCSEGEPLVEVFQERVRERETLSGVSTAARTLPVDEEVRVVGRRLLSGLSWRGPAMLEFVRRRDDGALLLVGLTGRLWGSVQLTIKAGVDVPLILYRMADGDIVPAGQVARAGVGFRWIVGDALGTLARVVGAGDPRDGGLPFIRRAKALADLMRRPEMKVAHDVLDAVDPMPFLFELQDLANQTRRR